MTNAQRPKGKKVPSRDGNFSLATANGSIPGVLLHSVKKAALMQGRRKAGRLTWCKMSEFRRLFLNSELAYLFS